MSDYYDGEFPTYIPVAERKKRARAKIEALRADGHDVRPITISGKKLTTTFWGLEWCRNLEHYSDYETRLPSGRSYVRHGAVVHLELGPGRIDALVLGSELYEVEITIAPVSQERWQQILSGCTGRIGSVVELLQGKLSDRVMASIATPETGLFPDPSDIRLSCTCPDWADLCKHLAAVLYGIGNRLDEQPELLFELRGCDPQELIERSAKGTLAALDEAGASSSGRKRLTSNLEGIFGITLADRSEPE